MSGIRWLNIFQSGFERKEYKILRSFFRKIENMAHKKDTNHEECIFVNEILNTFNNGEY